MSREPTDLSGLDLDFRDVATLCVFGKNPKVWSVNHAKWFHRRLLNSISESFGIGPEKELVIAAAAADVRLAGQINL